MDNMTTVKANRISVRRLPFCNGGEQFTWISNAHCDDWWDNDSHFKGYPKSTEKLSQTTLIKMGYVGIYKAVKE
jgi:hypothetical protein